jgi:hypothetical protein
MPGGKDRVDHGIGGADDLCNSAAGALVLAAASKGAVMAMPMFFSLAASRCSELDGLTPRIGSDPWSRLMEEERRRPGGSFA